MPRGYRLAIIAALGCLIAAASPQQPAADDKHRGRVRETEPKVEPRKPFVQTSVSRPVEAMVGDPGCPDGREDRKSNLCASWLSADAARSSADWARWTFFLGISTTGLLVWTLSETRGAVRRELRAYVSIVPTYLSVIRRPDQSMVAAMGFVMDNEGTTPAYDLIHAGNIVILEPDEAKTFFAAPEMAARPNIGEVVRVVIHKDKSKAGELTGTEFFSDDDFGRVSRGEAVLYGFGFVEYRDTYGLLRRTEFCQAANPQSFQVAMGVAQSLPGRKAELNWTAAPFHNRAT